MSSPARVLVITGARADYGLLRPLMAALRDDARFELLVLATGMHLEPRFTLGRGINELEGE